MPKQRDIVSLFAANLRRIREEKGYSLRQLERECTKAENSDLSRYEHGDVNIGLRKLEELAKALDVMPAELLLPPGYEIRKKE